MTIFEKVKAGIGAKEAAERYGLEVDGYGKPLCTFHNDRHRHPSLYVDDDHYHCFACGEHGDVIDLTAKLFDLSLRDAAYKLAYDFSITQDKPPDKAMPEKLHKKSEAQQLREAEELCFAALMADRKLLQMQRQQHRPKMPEEPPDNVYVGKQTQFRACTEGSLYNVEATNNIYAGGKRVRGFVGIEVLAKSPFLKW